MTDCFYVKDHEHPGEYILSPMCKVCAFCIEEEGVCGLNNCICVPQYDDSEDE